MAAAITRRSLFLPHEGREADPQPSAARLVAGDAPAPASATAEIGETCLLKRGVSCFLCVDACEAEALRLDLSFRPSGRVLVETAACTGCGACLETCPEGAISLGERLAA